jgi:NhaP-type Na+/H+ or K+/H+ antiporter/Trk K+ transport system NAD-binding subunit
LNNISLILAVALLVGVAAQILARLLKMPGIVVLLLLGMALGPEGVNLIQTDRLGNLLPQFVSTAVAIVLFEGGLILRIRQIRRESKIITRLITSGAVITAIGGTLAARFFLDWNWILCALFGSLVIVTGPTVIIPLLRRIHVKKNVQTILNAEAVLIDPIGAIFALVVLEVVTSTVGADFSHGLMEFVYRFGFGGLAGLAGGAVIAFSLRFDRVIPAEYANIFALAAVLFIFHSCNGFMPESGIMAVTIAGVVVGNLKNPVHRELGEFKEQLTVMLVGILFILLAADTKLDTIVELGKGGAALVATLILVVRPLEVLWCARGSGLDWREKLFISWMSPRGIVAAAVASLFATTLTKNGFEGGESLRAAVFLVIASTVCIQGLLAGPMASLLKLRLVQEGFLIFGANSLNRLSAKILLRLGQDVALLDRNIDHCRSAEEEGIPVIMGDALSSNILRRAEVDGKRYLIAATPNDNLNYMIIKYCRRLSKKGTALVAVKTQLFNRESLRSILAERWLGANVDTAHWTQQIDGGDVTAFEATLPDKDVKSDEIVKYLLAKPFQILPLFVLSRDQVDVFRPELSLRGGSRIFFLAKRSDAQSIVGDTEQFGIRDVKEF